MHVQLQAYCSFLRSRARTRINQTSSSRVLRIRAARSWVKSLCLRRLDLVLVQPPLPAEPTRGSVPIGDRGGRYPPTSLARQVGGASGSCEPDLATTGKLRYGQVPFRSDPRSGGIPPHGLAHGPPRVPTHAEPGQEQLL